MSRKFGGSEDITQEIPGQDPSLGTFLPVVIVSASLSTVVAVSMRALNSCLQHALQIHQLSGWLKIWNK